MKKIYIIIANLFILCSILILACRKQYLEQEPLGTLNEKTLANKSGVEGLLIGAYSLLDGVGQSGTGDPYYTPVSNYVLGDIGSDDSHKGSEYGDIPEYQQIENYTETPVILPFNEKWVALYAGVQRANDVLRVLAEVTDGSISSEEAKQITAEARFLRGVYHFEAAKIWRNVPYVDETVSYSNNNYNVPNTTPIWPKIEEDFKFAADNLTETKSEIARANSWAAKAFLAKVYMFQHKYSDAKTLLDDIIVNGVTSSGIKYALIPKFGDNFNPAEKNNSEDVFSVQMTVHDNSDGANGNAGDVLNFASGGPATCCGFNQPSFSLVNSFKTDPATGLPLLDTWNDSDVKNDQGLSSDAPFTPYTGTLDPRLDYTVGRRGMPYLDWGIMPGRIWIVSQDAMGPYIPIKNVYYKADQATTSDTYQGWAVNEVTANNYVMIRFADVLLWAAECEVEIGSLAKAEDYVNMIRARAANPEGWVHKYKDDNDPSKGFTDVPAANYKIGLYTGQFEQNGQDYARKAVRFERKLELAMEGHRFFDLQRYDNGTGYMADVLNAYIQHETHIPGYDFQYMKGATFTKGKNELYPIPQAQIDLSRENGEATLQQNPGY
ncbi:MAG: RagB/SusD family nutrient uptake outer membrane protein [Ginsengibacter sp.]